MSVLRGALVAWCTSGHLKVQLGFRIVVIVCVDAMARSFRPAPQAPTCRIFLSHGMLSRVRTLRRRAPIPSRYSHGLCSSCSPATWFTLHHPLC